MEEYPSPALNLSAGTGDWIYSCYLHERYSFMLGTTFRYIPNPSLSNARIHTLPKIT